MWVRRSDKDNEDGQEVQQEDDDNGQDNIKHTDIYLLLYA